MQGSLKQQVRNVLLSNRLRPMPLNELLLYIATSQIYVAFIENTTTEVCAAGHTISHLLNLLVEGLGVGGSGSDVGVAGSLVGAGGLLQGLGSLHVCLLSLVVAVGA
jgi:hypothetical protein